MIHLTNITKMYGPKILFRDSSIQINPGDKIGLVGYNGTGKTTLFRIITREERADEGTVSIPDRTVIGYFSQDVGEMKGCTALEQVKKGAGRISKVGERLEFLAKKLENAGGEEISDDEMMKLVEEYGELQSEFETRGGYDLEARAKEILSGLGFDVLDQMRSVEMFSGGWRMRIELARILLLNPDVLLMDEPTNHLDLESLIWLEHWLMNYKGALVMTSHDREFMNRIVNQIVEISNQKIVSYTGNYDFYERERDIRKDQLMAAHQRQNDMLAKEEEFIARFKARASHAAQVQSRVKKLDKIERIEIPAEERVMDFEFPEPPRSGNEVVKIEKLGKTYTRDDGSAKSVFKNATALVRRLDKVAVVGVNGAGKSTLLKIITEQIAGSEGNCALGANIKMGYFSQYSLDILDPESTILDEIHNRVPGSTLGFVRNLLGAFLFSGDDVYKKIKSLSGGEKSRVVLATILANPLNFLVLDEPTNHLDIKSREMLLKAIQKFEGTVMIVSHDRFFQRAITNRVFELDQGELRTYDGNYDYYLEKVEKSLQTK